MKRRAEETDRGPAKDPVGGSDPDAEAFARAMTDVVRLPPDPRARIPRTPVPSPPRRPTAPQSVAPEPSDDEQAEAGFVASGVDRRELRRLKRGDHAPGDRLDLHGLTAAEAVSTVQRFIDQARSRHRCVAIVHGRGLHSAGSVSILKTQVRQWLRRSPAVLAYADAPRTDGGAGAVYVLVRK